MVEYLLKDRARRMCHEPTEPEKRTVMRYWKNEVLTNLAGLQHAVATRLDLKWLP